MAEAKRRSARRPSVLDIGILLIVLAVIALGAYKFAQWRGGDPGETVRIVYTVRAEGLSPEIYEQLLPYVPSDIIDSGVRAGGEVTAVSKLPHRIAAFSEGTGSAWTEDPYHIDLLFTLEAVVSESGGAIRTRVGEQEVRAGRIYTVETEYFEIEGTIVTVDRPEDRTSPG